MTAPLLDAKQAAELLNVKPSWVLEEARHDRIPHIRLGRYVRFDSERLLSWAHNRTRGPAYYRETNSGPGGARTPRGPTPDLPRRTDAG